MATKWKLPYEEIVFVGDNPAKDFQAPQQLGMMSVYFHNRDGLYSSVTIEEQIENITDVKKLM